MKTKVNIIHMVGIGGAGMSGIAEVLLNLGYTVTGSDLSDGPVAERLRKLGAQVFVGHDRFNVGNAEVLVRSSAVDDANPEVKEALSRGIPIIPRAEMLAELMRLKTGIAVAGTHGKTTTTSFLATIFKEAGLEPTVIIGGRLNTYGSNALMGEGEYLIAEADESDGSFLCLLPIVTVVTNVDADHLDFYKDLAEIKEAFVRFLNKIPFYGKNILCGDDPVVKELLPRIKRPVMTYGLGSENALRGEIIERRERYRFKVYLKDEFWGEVTITQPGQHNVLNALGAIGVSIEAGVAKEAIVRGLAGFGGVARRFEIKGERDGVLVVDDYGHHPTEIRATIEAAKERYPDRRLVILFQPHRFSRTKALFGDFCRCFEKVDQLLLTEIYPASESPIPGVSGQSLAQGIHQVSAVAVDYFPDFQSVSKALPGIIKPNDLFMTMGAGPVWKVGIQYLKETGTS